jgi:outer membrane protein OmpA-like peptidoglycan-associated protein
MEVLPANRRIDRTPGRLERADLAGHVWGSSPHGPTIHSTSCHTPSGPRLAAASSDQQLQQAVRDREELRAKLLLQFNLIFATRDTARGLIVSLSDVLFDTGKSTLRPMAREKLAKISGIVLAYPDLRLAIERNTDSVGSNATNQELSEQRANSVRDYLAKENIPAGSSGSVVAGACAA